MSRWSVLRAWAGVLLPVVAVVVMLLVGLDQVDRSAPAVAAVFAGTLLFGAGVGSGPQ